MPIYDLACDCGNILTTYQKVEKRDSPVTCTCGRLFQRIIAAPMIAAAFQPYISPASGREISSRDQERNEIRRTNSIIKEPGVDRDVARNKSASIERGFTPLDKTVDATINHLINAGQMSPV